MKRAALPDLTSDPVLKRFFTRGLTVSEVRRTSAPKFAAPIQPDLFKRRTF